MIFEKRKEYNRLRCKWRELVKEYDGIKEMGEIAWMEFYNSAMEYIERNNLKSPFEPKEKKKEAANIGIFQEDETKKLFRRAAVQTHPDKHGGAYEDVFKDIAKAKHEGHLNKMLDGARKVNVKPKEISIDQIEALEKEVDELEKKIDEITYSVHWVWYHANNAQKENILETVLNHQDV